MSTRTVRTASSPVSGVACFQAIHRAAYRGGHAMPPPPPWSPTALGSNVIQRMDSLVYRESPIAGVPVLVDSSRTGSARAPLQGRALLFDGSNDFATRGARVTSAGITTLTVCGWVKFSHTNDAAFISEWQFGVNTRLWAMLSETNATGKLKVLLSSDGGVGAIKEYRSQTNINTGNWVHVAFTWDSGTLRLFVNGLEETTTKTSDAAFTSIANETGTNLLIGALLNSGSPTYFAGMSARDFRVYSVAKTPEQILAIANQHANPTTIDAAGILAGWYGNDQAGTTLRDWSGNGRHLTTSGITEATFHAADTGVLWNPANEVGHSRLIQLAVSGTGTSFTNAWLSNETFSGDFILRYRIDSIQNQLVGVTSESSITAFGQIDLCFRPTDGWWVNGSNVQSVSVSLPADSTLVIQRVGTTVTVRNTSGAILSTYATPFSGTVRAAASLNLGVATVLDSSIGYLTTLMIGGSNLSATDVIVPRNEATPANDVLGNALAHTGQVPHYATVDVPCVTGDGSAAYVDYGSRLIPATADFSLGFWYFHPSHTGAQRAILTQLNSISSAGRFWLIANSRHGVGTTFGWLHLQINGSPTTFDNSIDCLTPNSWHYITVTRVGSTITVTSQTVNGSLQSFSSTVAGLSIAQDRNTWSMRFDASTVNYWNEGRLADFRITTGGVTRFFPLQDGIGTAGTNRNVSWIGSDGTGGTIANAIVGGTLANVWANRTNVARDWAIQYGGRTSTGVFIPGHITGPNCVDGNPKTLLAGRNCNPNSRPNSNPFSAAGLNGTGSSTAIAVGMGRRLVVPANTKFSRSVRVSGFRSLDFDGVNDRVITTANGPSTTGRMVSLWFRTTATLGGGASSLISWGDGTLGQAFQVIFGTGGSLGTNAIGLSQWGDAVGQAGWNDGNWHHVVGRNNGQLWELWIDGALRASKTMTTAPTAGIIRLGGNGQSGAPGANYNYTGQLDDVRVFATGGTNEQIATLFANRAGPAIGGETLWICPTLDRDGFRTLTARDLTVGGNHGALTSMDAETDWIDETNSMDDRFFTVRTALTGADLTAAEEYVQ